SRRVLLLPLSAWLLVSLVCSPWYLLEQDFFSMVPPPPESTLFPYTTLFRSFSVVTVALTCLAASPGSATASVSSDQTDLAKLERSEEHTFELQSRSELVCRLLLEKKNPTPHRIIGRQMRDLIRR